MLLSVDSDGNGKMKFDQPENMYMYDYAEMSIIVRFHEFFREISTEQIIVVHRIVRR